MTEDKRTPDAQDDSRRTIQQNKYLWGVVYPTILKEPLLKGWTDKDLHDYLLGHYFGWNVVPGLFGETWHLPKKRSSNRSVKEFQGYVDFIQKEMSSRYGIYIPDPEVQE